MSHTSPASFLVWSILSFLLGAFLLHHLWSFDRFRCLRWNDGPYSGAFKRVMTYSYLLSVPLIMAYSMMFAVMKYIEGWTFIPKLGIVPTPYQMWPQSYQNAIFPLYLLFSVAWSLEMVTHLEELCFWLFLVNAGAAQQDWFRSMYFKTWAIGSVLALIYMPLVTSLTLSDPLKCEAYTFLAGSLGSLTLTLWFLPILWTFPNFLRNIKADGVDRAVIVRLTRFHEINTIRVFFRFLFVVPLLILGIDGITPHEHINSSYFWTDLLAMLSAVGCIVSSGMTLVIFFPRSAESELEAREILHQSQNANANGGDFQMVTVDDADNITLAGNTRDSYYAAKKMASAYGNHERLDSRSQLVTQTDTIGVDDSVSQRGAFSPKGPTGPSKIAWGRAAAAGTSPVAEDGSFRLTSANVEVHNKRQSNYSHHVHNFTSPINLIDRPVKLRRQEQV